MNERQRKFAEQTLAQKPDGVSAQEAAFLRLTGDMWYDVNVQDLGKDDPVSTLIEIAGIEPKEVLEIGCATGWRLRKLKEKYGCRVSGVEPSQKAVSAGVAEGLSAMGEIRIGTADELSFDDNRFDMVIYGYCFSYIDPALYFMVMHEGNRVLKDGGWLVLHDRMAPFAIKRQYADIQHKDKQHTYVYAHEMDFAGLWLAHPFYREAFTIKNPDKYEGVIIMRKDVEGAFMMGSNNKVGTVFEYD